jgi:hypothetical protein
LASIVATDSTTDTPTGVLIITGANQNLYPPALTAVFDAIMIAETG